MRRARPLVAGLALLLVGLLGGAATADPSGPAPSAPASPAAGPSEGSAGAAEPALQGTGRTDDGWERLALRDGTLPAPLEGPHGLRAEVHLVVDGLPRAFRVLVPPGAPRPAPVVVALHGLYESPQAADRAQRWGPVVRRHGVVLVQGFGHRASWNAGTCCGAARDERVDDVRYLDRVLEVVGALHPVDPRRVHATGFSNGAMMAYRWACERRGTVAGVLAVAGTVTSTCYGRSDVAVLHVHGLADRTVPLRGTRWQSSLGTSLRPVSRTTSWFGPRITARVLRGYGHGWPTSTRGGYATTEDGYRWLARHPRSARR